MENLYKNIESSKSDRNGHQQHISSKDLYKNCVLTIFSNIKNQNSKTQWKQMGKYYPLQKNYFYRQRILIFCILNFVYNNQASKLNKIKTYCEHFLQFLREQILQYQRNTLNQQIQSEINILNDETAKLNAEIETACKIKLENICKKIENKQNIINVESFLTLKQIQILLDILLKRYTFNQRSKNQFYKRIQNIFKQKVTFQRVQTSNKITHLHINSQNNIHLKLQLKKNQLLYQHFVLKIGKQIFSNIIQTNQQKYIFFKIEDISVDILTKITQLFNENQKQNMLESQDQDESDKNSQIVKDEQFYRISSKISTSCRKNSFNSGQKLPSQTDQKEVLSKYFHFEINNTNVSLNKAQYPTSQVYTRSSSFQKGNLMAKDLYTSIDLFMKLQGNKNQMIYKRKKSCENPKFRQTFSNDTGRHFNRIQSKIKINLIDESKSKANIFSQNYKSYQSCLPNNFPFLRLNKKPQQSTISQNKIGVIRNFFKQNPTSKQ